MLFCLITHDEAEIWVMMSWVVTRVPRGHVCLKRILPGFQWIPQAAFYGNLGLWRHKTSYENAREPGEMHASWDAWLMTFSEPLGFFNALICQEQLKLYYTDRYLSSWRSSSSGNPMNGIHGNSNKDSCSSFFTHYQIALNHV